MKSLIIWTAILMVALPAAAQQALKGNGNVVMTERRMNAFTGLIVDGTFDVFITIGEKNHLTIEADENLHEAVITRIEGNNLVISQRSPFKNVSKLVVYVAMSELDYLKVGGAVDVESNATFTGNKLELVANGAGDIELKIKVTELVAQVTGAANIVLHGQADKLMITVNGSGDLDARDVQARTGDIKVSGSGDVYTHISESIKATVSGSGSIYCAGNPTQRDLKEGGAGSIEISE